MLRGIGVTWRPKSKKVEFVKKSGEGIVDGEVIEALRYCEWRFGHKHKDHLLNGSRLTVGM